MLTQPASKLPLRACQSFVILTRTFETKRSIASSLTHSATRTTSPVSRDGIPRLLRTRNCKINTHCQISKRISLDKSPITATVEIYRNQPQPSTVIMMAEYFRVFYCGSPTVASQRPCSTLSTTFPPPCMEWREMRRILPNNQTLPIIICIGSVPGICK